METLLKSVHFKFLKCRLSMSFLCDKCDNKGGWLFQVVVLSLFTLLNYFMWLYSQPQLVWLKQWWNKWCHRFHVVWFRMIWLFLTFFFSSPPLFLCPVLLFSSSLLPSLIIFLFHIHTRYSHVQSFFRLSSWNCTIILLH